MAKRVPGRGRRSQVSAEDIQRVETPEDNVVLPTEELQKQTIADDPRLSQLADPEVPVDKEVISRPFVGAEGIEETVTPELLQEQVEAEERFSPLPINELGADPEGFRLAINERLKDVDSTFKERGEGKVPQPLSEGTSTDILESGERLISNILQESDENTIHYTDEDTFVSYSDIYSEVFGNTNPNAVGVALEASTLAITADPANLALLKFDRGSEQEQAAQKTAIFEALSKQESSIEQDEGEARSVNVIKAQSAQENLASYEHLDATARRIVELARTMTGAQEQDTTSDYNAEFGERVIQQKIDDGEVVIDSYLNPNSGVKTYFLRPAVNGSAKLDGARTITALTVPDQFQVSLGSKTPTSFKGNVGDKPRNKVDIKKLKDDPVVADGVYLSILGGVGKTPDTLVHGLVNQLLENSDTNDIAAAYFKVDKNELDQKFRSDEQKEFRRLVAQGMEETQARINAKRKAEKLAKSHIKQVKSQKAFEMGMLENLDGEVRFAEWGLGSNMRAQIISRDMQNEQKDTLRAVWNFTERGYIRKDDSTPEKIKSEALNYARSLNNILFPGNRAGDISKVMEQLNSIPQDKLFKINQQIIWTQAYIQMAPGAKQAEYIGLDGKERKVNINRMNPPEVLKFFSDNHESIMGFLANKGEKILDWAQNGINFQDADATKIFERGHMPYFVRAATDAHAFVNAKDGEHVKLEGRTEIDQSNSNIIIHALKTGHTGAASTLGFDIDPRDPEAWFDNPDSFYNILGDNMYAHVGTFVPDGPSREAWGTFFDTINNVDRNVEGKIVGGKFKDNTRAILIEGAYGLHPLVNRDAAESVFNQFPEAKSQLMSALKTDNHEKVLDTFLRIRGATYDDTLGKISATKMMKAGGALLTIGGDSTFDLKTDTGALIRFGAGELTPEYLDNDVFEMATDGRYKAKKKAQIYKDKDGNEVPVLSVRKRTDYSKGKFTYKQNADGSYEVDDISKGPGIAIGDSLSAILTHATDASLMKTSMLLQNMGRDVAMPNDPIHDANQLNAVSYLHHWAAYHLGALPALATEGNTFNQVYDKVLDHYKIVQGRIRDHEGLVPVGTNSDMRTIFSILDYHSKNISDGDSNILEDAPKNDIHIDNNNKKKDLLKKAEQVGYIPKDSPGASDRVDIAVPKQAALELLHIVYQIQGFKPLPGERSARMEGLVNRWASQNKEVVNRVKKGLFRTQAQRP